uniref:Cytochrome c biogenesis protein CcsB n=1 Tax=Climaconeis cf. scalaris TaxID=2846828 RepID=A0A8F8SP32_9STRA|nr:c-type cytochrome biogenesis protein [Climaconeis cf. scalaris]QYB19134.1 c-type cytochrome biogenesis protein [Climaconeis cf. scalaris]
MNFFFFRFIADLRFSIFILLLISIFSILGTIIEQDQSIEIYKLNYPLINPVFGFLTWNLIFKIGLNHVYKTWWFLTLIILLGFSLISCTFLQQFPTLKIARRCQFFRKIKQFYKLKIFIKLKNFNLNKILVNLKKNQYLIFQQKSILYCYKGLVGRIAPIIVHFSIILVLVGTVFSSLFGFKAQEIIPITENFHIQNILNSGQLATIPKVSGRINDFWIIYTKNKTISQFYSDISILNKKGNEIERKTISVNYPLIYDNIYYYQTNWNLIGLRFQLQKNQIIEYPLTTILNNKNKIWLTWISDTNSLNTGQIAIIEGLEGHCSIYNEMGKYIGNIELNESANFKNPFRLLEILSSTGLQIKTDPGIPIIYIGFFFLILSTLLSYITYSQIWIIQKNKNIFIGGTTNRAFFDFELEFLKFVKQTVIK